MWRFEAEDAVCHADGESLILLLCPFSVQLCQYIANKFSFDCGFTSASNAFKRAKGLRECQWELQPWPNMKINVDGSAIGNSGNAGWWSVFRNHKDSKAVNYGFQHWRTTMAVEDKMEMWDMPDRKGIAQNLASANTLVLNWTQGHRFSRGTNFQCFPITGDGSV
ncbi:hypothetical protein IFM89_031234 [Coptis chinensis]|uniref:Uncharacterized protein n=1 Tax=Coptis chinensis TaxID=261450 RepID=A0A835IRK6_9MAGN|nr:hypothetical protein IFM89_031234 [Coptis chinensis]